MPNNNIAIIGAGLAGSLLSIYLAKRGLRVDVYEARGDMRLGDAARGRSINMALSERGIAALREIGMDEYMLNAAIPMHGRMIHTPSGETKLLPYSGRKGEYINSISRSGLNAALMTEAERHAGITFHFKEQCTDYDPENGNLSFASGKSVVSGLVFAADGAGSALRHSLASSIADFRSRSDFLEHGYKELVIPSGEAGSFLIEKNALHIWPRHKFMMIALPNLDGSFTCTLFLALNAPEGSDEPSFAALTDEASLVDFFEREFSDALPLMPTLAEDFFANPTGTLGTVHCSPWHFEGRVLLLGDAAHAMVPFYGQGMNCAFEDVRTLDRIIDRDGPDWAEVFAAFEQDRMPNAAAIQALAIENFYEMRDKVADPVFQKKRELETRLEQTYDDYFSKYSMVTFREDLPYAEAKRRGNLQDDVLMQLCSQASESSQIDAEEAIRLVRSIG
ncbi:MAG: FAD-binding monooxygenase [Acidobacteria bacterium OLB17]|nr:MAG: FAD-binding monooxygenase [Acidobacteria bacterium OLB17]MCZ2391277.1 FAD-dependent monooxygenase [Acidobacteriota bacterium]